MPYSNSQFEVTNYLGNILGKKHPYMKAIACMSQEWRLTRSYLEVVRLLKTYSEKNNKSALGQEDKIKLMCEISESIGQADWQMDVVSHLAMKIGRDYKKYDAE